MISITSAIPNWSSRPSSSCRAPTSRFRCRIQCAGRHKIALGGCTRRGEHAAAHRDADRLARICPGDERPLLEHRGSASCEQPSGFQCAKKELNGTGAVVSYLYCGSGIPTTYEAGRESHGSQSDKSRLSRPVRKQLFLGLDGTHP
jgi:hypothetical protein